MFKEQKYYLPGLGQCWLIVAILLVLGVIVASVFMLAAIIMNPEDMGNASRFTENKLTLTYILQMLPAMIYIWAVARHKRNLYLQGGQAVPTQKIDAPALGWFGKNPAHAILLFMVLAVAIFTFGYAFDPLFNIFSPPEAIAKTLETIRSHPLDTFIAVAICAPLIEEFILRGTMERGLLHHGSPTAAILWTAFIFALIHMNLWQALAGFASGILFGWIYYRTHLLWTTIFMHFVNNATAILMPWFFPNLPVDASTKELIIFCGGTNATYWLIVSIAMIIFIACIWVLQKYLPKGGGWKENS